MTRTHDPDDHFLYLIHLFIGDASPWPDSSQLVEKVPLTTVDHLLCLLHKIWCSAFAKTTSNRTIKTEEDKPIAINSASELQEAGIKFKTSTKNNILDIKFVAGTITIPEFTVSDETDSTLKNLIAYEHSFGDNHPKFVTDYAFFLHCLINSAKDVEILRRRGILTNYLGDDRAAYQMFNRLGQNILVSNNFCYAEVCDLVNGHGGRRRNRWMAMLRRNYFNSPWAFVSFLAASMLLLLTLTQTVFSVLSYVNHK